MQRIVVSTALHTILIVTLLFSVVLSAQQAQSVAPVSSAPIPAQILSAKSVFISYGGQDSTPYPGNDWTYGGGLSRTYDQFHAALKAWGRYELVDAPAKCDLVVQVRSSFAAPSGPLRMRVEILDPKTHVVLWGFTEYVRHSSIQSRRDKYFDEALERLVDDVKSLAGPPVASAQK